MYRFYSHSPKSADLLQQFDKFTSADNSLPARISITIMWLADTPHTNIASLAEVITFIWFAWRRRYDAIMLSLAFTDHWLNHFRRLVCLSISAVCQVKCVALFGLRRFKTCCFVTHWVSALVLHPCPVCFRGHPVPTHPIQFHCCLSGFCRASHTIAHLNQLCWRRTPVKTGQWTRWTSTEKTWSREISYFPLCTFLFAAQSEGILSLAL